MRKETDRTNLNETPPGKMLFGAVVAIIVIVYLGNYPESQQSQTPARPQDSLTERKPPTEPSVKVSTIFEAQIVARNLINEAGESCDAVTSLTPMGSIESGGGVLRASCTNGDRYVMVLSEDNRIRYLSSCTIFAVSTGSSC